MEELLKVDGFQDLNENDTLLIDGGSAWKAIAKIIEIVGIIDFFVDFYNGVRDGYNKTAW